MKGKKFEQALKELEQIVTKLEDESLPLEESIALYEKGIELSKTCSKKLNEAQAKIENLTKNFDTKEE